MLRRLLRQAKLIGAEDSAIVDREIAGVCSDSRSVKKGDIYVALRGLHHDGGDFVRQAVAKGAVFAVCERPLSGIDTLVVENAAAALACLWDAWYGHPTSKMKLIGITGTNGKTSTAYMLAHILRQTGHICGLIGTVECSLNDRVLSSRVQDPLANMTTPDPAQLYRLLAEMRQGGAEYAVMEVTSHALALSKVAPLRFYRALFTNLTPDHLDFHGDMESYFLEKRKLFSQCDGAVIATRSAYGERLADGLDLPLWRVDDRTVTDPVLSGADGVKFVLHPPIGSPLPVEMGVPGEFSVENGALAAMTAVSVGVPSVEVKRSLSSFVGVRGRMERISPSDFCATVFVDYAHTPDALEKLLRTARGFCGEAHRVTVLFGCGGDRDKSKRSRMGQIASSLADFVIVTSDNCRTERAKDILRDILKGVDKEKPYKVIEDRKEAVEFAIRTARQGDVILLAGKGHEEYEIKGSERLDFSERRIVAAAIAARREREKGAD